MTAVGLEILGLIGKKWGTIHSGVLGDLGHRNMYELSIKKALTNHENGSNSNPTS